MVTAYVSARNIRRLTIYYAGGVVLPRPSTTPVVTSPVRLPIAHDPLLASGADASSRSTTPPALNFAIFLIFLWLSPEVNNIYRPQACFRRHRVTRTARSYFIHFFFQPSIYFLHHNHLSPTTIPYIPHPTLKTPFKSQSKS